MVSRVNLGQLAIGAVVGAGAGLAVRLASGREAGVPGNSAPVADFSWTPSDPSAGETVTFDGTTSTDRDGTIVEYEWNIGGTQRSGATVQHTFASDGNYDVTLTVTDDDGAIGFSTRTVSVGVVTNNPPTAAFAWTPQAPGTGETVTFDASASDDVDGVIDSFEWVIEGTTTTGEVVTHTFQNPGDYDVRLTVTDNDGASDSVVNVVSVANQAPTADFTFSPSSPLSGEQVTFDASGSFDPDGSIASYEWSVDGTTKTGQTMTHTFDLSQSYSVTLTVTDDQGATGSVTRTVNVANRAPTASFSYGPTNPVSNEQVTFDASNSSDPDGSIASYEWNVEGQTLAGESATHTFDSPGSYSVTLTVADDDGATDSTTQTISVDNPIPTADFTISPQSPVEGESVTLDATASSDPNGTIESYDWQIGSSTDSGQIVTTSFATAGTYDITLTVTDDDGATGTLQQTVSVGEANDPPVADFTWTPTSPQTFDTVTFDASASSDPDGSIASYEWTIGANTLTGQQASFQFPDNGDYDVQLVVTDDGGATDTLTRTITVSNRAPFAFFFWTPEVPEVGETVTFDAVESSDDDGQIVRYEWVIENQTLTGQQLDYVFDAAGSYDVQLTTIDDDGAATTTSNTVDVNAAPTADFSWSPTNPSVGEEVTFDASASSDPAPGTIASYEWTIAGSTFTGQTVTHTFSTEGSHDVTLTVTDDNGATDTLTQTVNVANLAPTADFSWSPTNPAVGEVVTFDGTTSFDEDGTVVSYDWVLNGDPLTVAELQASTLFRSFDNETVGAQPTGTTLRLDAQQGDYTVQDFDNRRVNRFLASTQAARGLSYDGIAATGVTECWAKMYPEPGSNGTGATNSARIVLFTTDNPRNEYGLILNNAEFSQDSLNLYRRQDGSFQRLDSVDITLGPAEFREFRFRITPGSPNRLQVRMWAEGEAEPSTWDMDVTNDALDLSSGGAQDGGWVGTLQFGDQAAYFDAISFGVDGAAAPTDQPEQAGIIEHTFTASGDYNMELTVTDDDGATDSLLQTVTVTGDNVPPTADFTWTPTSPTNEDTITFDASGSSDTDGSIVSYEWQIDGAAAGTGQTISTQLSAGNHTVTLTVTDDDGSTDTLQQTLSVEGLPTADFSFTEDPFFQAHFDGTLSSDPDGSIQSWSWNFGDFATATGATPDHTYESGGDYSVELTVTDADGNTDFIERTIHINQAPVPDFTWSPSSPVVGEQVTFDASATTDPDDDPADLTYEWTFPDESTASGVQVTHTFAEAGDWAILLSVTDPTGTVADIVKSVSVGTATATPVVRDDTFGLSDID